MDYHDPGGIHNIACQAYGVGPGTVKPGPEGTRESARLRASTGDGWHLGLYIDRQNNGIICASCASSKAVMGWR